MASLFRGCVAALLLGAALLPLAACRHTYCPKSAAKAQDTLVQLNTQPPKADK